MSKIVNFIVKLLATGGFVGYIPILKGTFGTLVGVLIYILLSHSQLIYFSLLLVLMVIAIPVSEYAEKSIFKEKDPKHIVIDEVVGFMVATIGFVFTPDFKGIITLTLIFIVFRAFDILKPFPISAIQKVDHSVSIVLDDVFAGVLTNLTVRLLLFTNILSINPF